MNKTVLIVDDEKHIRLDLCRYLNRQGFTVDSASTMEEAEKIIESKIFDYAVIDLKLDNPSEYGGIQFFFFVKHHQKQIKPIILSAYPLDEQVKDEFEKEFKKEFKENFNRKSLFKEIEDNYIPKGGEANYILAILEKLEDLEKNRLYCNPIFGCYHSLLIAVQDYKHNGIPKLHQPIKDAKNIGKVLTQNYTFHEENIYFLENPDRETILCKLSDLSERMTLNDNLLIFYAGHGHWDEVCNQGYWLPKSAKQSNRSEWISNGDIREHIRKIKTQHTLLISDACFAGGIFRTRESLPSDTSISFDTIYKNKSRKAMTSGAMEPVPDNSIFLKFLLERLKNNNNEHLSACKLYADIYDPVKEHGIESEYNMIRDTDDSGGHFIFVQK